MSVYVDLTKLPYKRMKMCHLRADSLTELHEMAERIGIRRVHFQPHPRHPHYDICLSKRRLAVLAGAIELSTRQTAKRLVGAVWK